MTKIIKCSKWKLLEFIKKKGMVENWEVAQMYKFSVFTVSSKLIRLQKQGLVKSFGRGHWVLTEDGIRRLRLYGKKQED
jgi:Mn-dependent DtxR family transcriptional regulator